MDQNLKSGMVVPQVLTSVNAFKHFISGAGEGFSLEHRIFNVSSFFITSFGLLASLVNYVIGLNLTIVWLGLVGASVSFYLYYNARFRNRFSLATIIQYVLATITLLSVIHFYNGGMDGTVIYLIIMLLNIFLLIMPARYQYWVLVVLYANVLILLLLEYYYPQLVVPYSSQEERLADHAATMLYSMFYTAIVIVSFRKSYFTERQKVLEQNQQLQLLNGQIEEQRLALETKTEALETAVAKATEQHENIKVLLKELNHRVKNNLQVVSSLLNLQAHAIDDEKAKSAIQESRNRLQSMVLIHQRLYHHENATRIFMPEYLQDLAESLMVTYTGELDDRFISYEVDPVWLKVEKAIPVGLICNELITNCFKHTISKGTGKKIRLKLEGKDEKFCLTIADDGPGFTQPVSGRSFGLDLVRSLVKQVGGTSEIKLDKGTSWKICFE